MNVCRRCMADGKSSRVEGGGHSFVTAMVGHNYYDENGHAHNHDPNTRTTQYACTNGHAWFVVTKPRCGVLGCGEVGSYRRVDN